MDKFVRYALIFIFLFFPLSAWSMGRVSTQRVDSPLIGKSAPDVVLGKTDGTSASVVASRQGKKAILVFWATWCPHCYEELGTINEQYASSEKKGIKIILVDVGETVEKVKSYFDQRQLKMISFIDEDNYLLGEYHLEGIPTLLFIDEKGIIRNVTHLFPSDYENYF